MPAADFPLSSMTMWSTPMTAVMIGTGPHKGSHTAVAISADEHPLGKMRVRACPAQAEQLAAWAQAWPERAWAVEGAAGLGHLLARQLVAAGEYVVDVPPRLAAGVRMMEAGKRTTTTRSMPGRWRLRRCGPRPRARCSPRTTPWC
jgi:hypothetical protein